MQVEEGASVTGMGGPMAKRSYQYIASLIYYTYVQQL